MRPDHFGLIARFYDRVFHFLGPERLMSLLQARPSERILDIGGGTGRVSRTFGDDYVVVVCDSSWRMLREARQKQMIACCGLAEHLPLADGAFDRIVMVDTFHHLRHQHTAAKETLRVLRPGGRLVIEEPDIRQRAVKWTALGERLLLMRSRFYSIADLARVFEEAGGTIVALEEGQDYNVRLAVERGAGRDMEDLIQEFINQRIWAVVGASLNPEKYGHKIFRNLRAAGYVVYGVNAGGGEIDGQSLYPSLADLPEKPVVVDIVVPPQVTEEIVRQCAELGLGRVWMQPGSESEEAIRFCQEKGIRVVHDACAMLRKREW